MKFPSREIVKKVRDEYPIGTRVELVQMEDVQAPPIGTRGTVIGVDDIASIMVKWDSGSSLNVIYGVDICKKIEVQKLEELRIALERMGEILIIGGENFKFSLKQIAEALEKQQERVFKEVFGIVEDNDISNEMVRFRDICNSLNESTQQLTELSQSLEMVENLCLPPTEIKKRLKYAKNPMEIKQLNRQLTISYKKYKKKK